MEEERQNPHMERVNIYVRLNDPTRRNYELIL